jgi:hypothetical protein
MSLATLHLGVVCHSSTAVYLPTPQHRTNAEAAHTGSSFVSGVNYLLQQPTILSDCWRCSGLFQVSDWRSLVGTNLRDRVQSYSRLFDGSWTTKPYIDSPCFCWLIPQDPGDHGNVTKLIPELVVGDCTRPLRLGKVDTDVGQAEAKRNHKGMNGNGNTRSASR